MSLYEVAVPTFKRSLTSLSAILKKAEGHSEASNIDPEVLVNSRLYPDMHPLKRQIQMATDTARRGGGQLAGVEVPSLEDTEETFAELQNRITKTIEFLDTLLPEQFEGAETKTIELPVPGNTIRLDGTSFLMGFALANFSFHVVTAYNILRHNGVVIGKMDYLGTP
jgi:hypothetical protein